MEWYEIGCMDGEETIKLGPSGSEVGCSFPEEADSVTSAWQKLRAEQAALRPSQPRSDLHRGPSGHSTCPLTSRCASIHTRYYGIIQMNCG